MTAKEAGGIPPFGQDFNGIFFDITQILQYMQAGGHPTYSSELSTAIGGYPLGAMLAKASGMGFWRNITASNTTNPDSGGAGWISDSAGSYANATTVTASSTTLTPAQAGQAFLFTATASTVALPAASGIASGGAYKLHTSAGFTLSVSGGGAMQAGNASVTSLLVPAGTEVLAVSTGAAWWVFGTGQTLSNLGLVGGLRNLKASATGTSATVTVTADQIALDSTAGAPPLLVNSVSVFPSLTVSGANGLDAGTSAASAWYSVWVISNGTTVAGLLSLSSTAPTMPSGYTYRRRVGWVRTDATANKYPFSFLQNGCHITYRVNAGTNLTQPRAAASGIVGSLSSYTAVNISQFVPDTAVSANFILSGTFNNTASMLSPSSAWPLPSGSDGPCLFANAQATSTLIVTNGWITLESQNVYYGSSSSSSKLIVVGWMDTL
jgi:hypothetical protein